MIDFIKKTLSASGNEMEISADEWDLGPIVIAGMTHLPKREQLMKWCEQNEIRCMYSPKNHEYWLKKM